ncbi:MAG TPA: right-handed parallel beta-helix repeat-containing protein [Chthonomonadales bacterium]|nr:right-handed parallel beta-helix repeat-containing protein [Chthonomonadales bacterium]
MKTRMWLVGASLLAVLATAPAHARNWAVSPFGTPTGAGTYASPLDLATAIGPGSPVRPGHAIWMRGGVYRGNFRSDLVGTGTAPIVVRAWWRERPRIDGTLHVHGSDTWFWGLEVFQSTRNVLERRTGIEVFGPRTKLINCVVRDTAQGVGFWSRAVDAEMHGCIIYRNGFIDPTTGRATGHGIYMQNDTGTMRVNDCLVIDQASFGIHAYGQAGQVRNMTFERNVVVGNAWLVGGTRNPSTNIVVDRNFTWGSTFRMGFWAQGNRDLSFTNNLFVNRAGDAMQVNNSDHMTMIGNRLYAVGERGTPLMWSLPDRTDPPTPPAALNLSGNVYNHMAGVLTIGLAGYGWKTLEWWQSFTNSDRDSSAVRYIPGGVETHLIPNRFDPRRAHLVVYNWSGEGTVSFNPAQVLPRGMAFTVRNAYNYPSTPVLTGVVDGNPVEVPITGSRTAPAFAVFVITRAGFF